MLSMAEEDPAGSVPVAQGFFYCPWPKLACEATHDMPI